MTVPGGGVPASSRVNPPSHSLPVSHQTLLTLTPLCVSPFFSSGLADAPTWSMLSSPPGWIWFQRNISNCHSLLPPSIQPFWWPDHSKADATIYATPASVAAAALRMGLSSQSGLIFQDVASGHHTSGPCDHCPCALYPAVRRTARPRRQPPALLGRSLPLLSSVLQLLLLLFTCLPPPLREACWAPPCRMACVICLFIPP